MCRPTGYEIGSTRKYICCFIRVAHAIKLCVLETEGFFELIYVVSSAEHAVISKLYKRYAASHIRINIHSDVITVTSFVEKRLGTTDGRTDHYRKLLLADSFTDRQRIQLVTNSTALRLSSATDMYRFSKFAEACWVAVCLLHIE